MCKYCGTNNYRKIYLNHHGPIPTDNTGKTYDIHHIDGDRNNNSPGNLKAVSLQEHYDIHYSQQDWSACSRLAYRLGMSKEVIADLARQNALRLVQEGTHNFLTINTDRVANGTHHWLGGTYQREYALRRIREGRHNNTLPDGQMQSKIQKKRVQEGTHNFLGGEIQRQAMKNRVINGTHNFSSSEWQKNRSAKQIERGNHPSQLKASCIYCKSSGGYYAMKKYHFDNCKLKCD